MSYLKSKVLPKIKKFFEKSQKRRSSEAIKEFDSSKESISKELEEKKGELQPKVVEIYKSSEDKTKILLKDPSPSAIDADPTLVQALLKELATAGFPGATTLSDSVAKFGTAAMAAPITFLLSKASVFLQDEPSPIIAAATDAPISEGDAPAAVEVAVKDIAPAGETSAATETASEESTKEATSTDAATETAFEESAKEVITNTDAVSTEVDKVIEKEELAAAEPVNAQPQT